MDVCSKINKRNSQNRTRGLTLLHSFSSVCRTSSREGHALDQKRLKQPLYRHPWDDVMYMTSELRPGDE
jgi:hypothetical protein